MNLINVPANGCEICGSDQYTKIRKLEGNGRNLILCGVCQRIVTKLSPSNQFPDVIGKLRSVTDESGSLTKCITCVLNNQNYPGELIPERDGWQYCPFHSKAIRDPHRPYKPAIM